VAIILTFILLSTGFTIGIGSAYDSSGQDSQESFQSTSQAKATDNPMAKEQSPENEPMSIVSDYIDLVDYTDVLLIRNNNSAVSMDIADHFRSERNISYTNVCNISTSTGEVISRAVFESEVRAPVEDCIVSRGLLNTVDFMVTTKGVPLKISEDNTADDNWSQPWTIDRASVDAELMLILGPYAGSIGTTWWINNPYFDLTPFQEFDRDTYGIFLVTRLTAHNTSQAKGLVDKAPHGIGQKGRFVFDVDPNRDGSPGYKIGNDWMRWAEPILTARGFEVFLDETAEFLTEEDNVSGYASWGSNDGNYSLIVNSNTGFETPGAIPQNASGWFFDSDVGNDQIDRNDTMSSSGSWSVRIQRTAINGNHSAVSQNVTIKPDTRYYLSGVTNTSGVTPEQGAHLRVGAYNETGAMVWEMNGTSRTGTTTAWRSLNQVKFEPIEGVTKLTVSAVLSQSSGEAYFDNIQLRQIRPHNYWLPGAIAETYVSTGGRSFNYGTQYGQTLVSDLILDGVTGVKGYVYEPYLDAISHPNILFDAFTLGYNLAESYYLGSEYLGWMDTVVGDPKLAPYKPSYIPDLAVAAVDISFSKTIPVTGETIDIYADVHNYGNFSARGVRIEFYDGDPMGGGTLINSTVIDVDAHSINQTSIQWNTTGYLGTYDIYVFADAIDRVFELSESNNIAFSSLEVKEVSWQLPELTNPQANPPVQENGGNVNITVDVSDDVWVDLVAVNVTYPDMSTVNSSMTKGMGDEWFFETSYSDIGGYAFAIWAKDDIDNWNSTSSSFTIIDTDPPEIFNLMHAPSPQYLDGNVNITVDVVDDVAVGSVWLNVTHPGGSWTNISMTKGPGDQWYNETSYSELGDHDYFVWAGDTSNNWNSSMGQFTILPHGVDYIQIRDMPGGLGISLSDSANYPSYPVGAADTFYGALYNDSVGYLGDIPATSTWSSSNDTIMKAMSPGDYSVITCNNTNYGTVIITLSASGHSNTTEVTVLQPTVDYIRILDGNGDEINNLVLGVYDAITLYAAGYNDTAGYIGNVAVDWSVSVPGVGTFSDSTGVSSTTFTAEKVSSDVFLFHITASPSGLPSVADATTGFISVLAPRPDYIVIRSGDTESSPAVTHLNLQEGQSALLYAYIYNHSCGFIGIFSVTWGVEGEIGNADPAIGNWTRFNAALEGQGNVTASYSSGGSTVSNKTSVTVSDRTPPAPPADLEIEVVSNGKIRLTWSIPVIGNIPRYIVYRTTNPDDPTSWISLTGIPIMGNTYIDEGLDTNTKYYYRLVAVDDAIPVPNSSDYSDTVSAIPEVGEEGDILPWIIIVIIIVIIAVVVVLWLVMRRRKPAEEESVLEEEKESVTDWDEEQGSE
jgi:uncharacterized protein (TIGR03790 family)